jgi:hypothetical protein
MTRPDLTVVPEASRLRVITAGDVGNVHSRLGAGGFDVVAVVDTEADLVVAVSSSEPDAILVEADLCESLEPIRELAPDATLVVVGDHTPAGALGHIDRGVSGTVLAGLLHALAVGGASAAVAVPGFVLAPTPTPPPPTPATFGLGQAVTAGVVGAVIVAGVALGLVMGKPASEERTQAEPSAPPPAVSSPAPPPAIEPAPEPSPSARPKRSPSADRAEAPDQQPPGGPAPAVEPAPEPSQAPAGERATAPHPPGRAYGWDRRPPKDQDHGRHEGWTQGNGPKP